MKKLLILQLRPEDETADSELNAILQVGGLSPIDVERIRLEKGIPVIDLNDYTGIIVGGSPFDVSTADNQKSILQKNIEAFFNTLFDDVVDRDFPFLGACSGNGLLGNYCGATISTTYSEPIGSVEVRITEEGKEDPLLKNLPETFSALVGHKEACDSIPPGAVLLATSATCPVQMFRVKQHIYATQFHPEADANEFILRINIYKNHGYFPPEEANDLINRVQKTNTPIPKIILKHFVERYHI
ncbi:glutamine amidotransferase [Maribacter polysiphoniae]|uniref:GMP synthase (Glutamine-hydrolysing) n=1 Tax=Maribacter polysiphoniae TaxID=429344 RepID=A0A316E3S5_9FLAO|nr:glutamine amidotransferase [Maribacter polysiphoniae]MBD1259149.1 glutamine amidotransferase [Maribacter polysiphoniae]PWK24705.1 GMP synthase (glutamine-hydrolysing) [Maribacter polysiphoniae]